MRHNVRLLVAAFVLTRVVLGGAAVVATGVYERIPTDTNLYARYAEELMGQGLAPYSEVDIEYPPVLLPFLAVPELLPDVAYRTLWVPLMVAVDAAGLAAVLRLGRRWGSTAGGWWWVGLFPLLGPLVYTRYDLIPAVAAVWSLERAAAGRPLGQGGWLAVGALAKLWPGLLVPTALAWTRRPWRLIAGGALVTAAVLAPFARVLPDLATDVLGYHLARGVQVESLWANGLLLAAKLGYPVEVVRNYGAAHLGSGVSDLLKALSSALTLTAAVAGALWARRRLARDDARGLAALTFAVVAVLVVVGSVLSPQFLIWVAALGAASQADPDSPVRAAVRWLAPAAVVNHVLYPAWYRELVREFDAVAIGVLSARNLLLLVVAVLAVRGVLSAARRGTSFSALVTELVEREPAPLPYAAVIDDDPDLSLKVQEVLRRLAR